MPAPLIVVTAGHKTPPEPYEKAVERAGARPLVLTPSGAVPPLPDDAAGLVLAGGASVEPARYGSGIEPGVTPTMDPPRDALEWAMIDQALERGLPILAICRGLQVVNVYYGGSLHQELARTSYAPVHRPDQARNHVAHPVRAHGGRLAELLGPDQIWVNSIHRQGVKRLGTGLLATVFADDGLIEGVETPDGQVLAVQWHPEELVAHDPAARALFTDLVERSRRRTTIGVTS
ncbi:gamma-glutamyl-gamma-aminobutyrate hydrolase family protein [Jiangella sp. DSM 45060]|uniref:gamma-glutamyl-gamma-aminobutyrate hydrolase family protein n=1 Tax=Jiangella sp. DSM 45060 TaxID=1798224 RepID=UPI000879CD26|nr:gamma-glutamyl-gamma-aminobutyrate hydrolase family protein [Jiangella sp. DSM 45060]SDT57218.1 putative glutamine amidotransferase [Jiangella sp. DSM 45060]